MIEDSSGNENLTGIGESHISPVNMSNFEGDYDGDNNLAETSAEGLMEQTARSIVFVLFVSQNYVWAGIDAKSFVSLGRIKSSCFFPQILSHHFIRRILPTDLFTM